MSDGMPALRLVHISKRFGEVVAVDGASLDLDANEVVALVGPSGCGKSTLLRAVAGLQPIDAGTIELGGRIVDDGRRPVPTEQRRVGLVFQEHALFPHLSVADNVAFGVRDRDPAPRVSEMLHTVGLESHADRFPHELSGGERQRVALARALAPAPALMLLDEPFANLDTNLRARVRDEVIEILRATSTPAVFVTHDQHDALAVGDRVAVMRSGRLVQIGPPVELFHAPVDRFVASFMGEASYLGVEDAAQVAGIDLQVPAGGITLMLRPDDVVLDPDADSGAVVEHAEFRGATWCYSVRLPGGAIVKSLRNHLRPLAVGSTVAASVTPGHRPVVLRD